MRTRLPGLSRAVLVVLGLVLLILGGTLGTSVGWWLGIPLAIGGAASLVYGVWPRSRGPLSMVGGDQSEEVLRSVSKRWGGM